MNSLQQNSPEWLEWRRDKIGASDAPVIMGESPWRTPRELWISKKEGIEQEDTPWMKRGRDMEKTALEWFEKETGLIMFPAVVTHRSKPWMIASLDGLTMDHDAAAEVKNPGKSDHDLAVKGIVPEKYIPQIQHQIEVTELKSIYYVSFYEGRGVYIEVKRDEKYILKLLKKELEFYEMLTKGIMPPMCDKDYRKREDENWFTLEREWAVSYYDLQKAKEIEEKRRMDVIKGSDGQSCFGKLIKATKFVEKGRVNYRSIPALKGINLDQFRGDSTERWRLSIRK